VVFYYHPDQVYLPLLQLLSLHDIHVASYSVLLFVHWFPGPSYVRGIHVVFYFSLPSLFSPHLENILWREFQKKMRTKPVSLVVNILVSSALLRLIVFDMSPNAGRASRGSPIADL
jgi:hypothetical protein